MRSPHLVGTVGERKPQPGGETDPGTGGGMPAGDTGEVLTIHDRLVGEFTGAVDDVVLARIETERLGHR